MNARKNALNLTSLKYGIFGLFLKNYVILVVVITMKLNAMLIWIVVLAPKMSCPMPPPSDNGQFENGERGDRKEDENDALKDILSVKISLGLGFHKSSYRFTDNC